VGVSPKRFGGWEPTETHTYAYDEAGRVASVEVTREVEWDEGERALVVALLSYRAQCCPSGHYLPTASAAESEFGFAAHARRCHMCTAVAVEANRVKDNPHPSAYLYRVAKRGVRGG